MRWQQLPKAVGNRDLPLVLFKLPIRPRLSLGTFVGNVRIRFRECPVSLVQPLPERPTDQHSPLHRDHSRQFEQNLYVYPVLARRSRGISVGINLNPDTVCNFGCVYCQVDRRTPPQVTDVDEEQLLRELEETL